MTIQLMTDRWTVDNTRACSRFEGAVQWNVGAVRDGDED